MGPPLAGAARKQALEAQARVWNISAPTLTLQLIPLPWGDVAEPGQIGAA